MKLKQRMFSRVDGELYELVEVEYEGRMMSSDPAETTAAPAPIELSRKSLGLYRHQREDELVREDHVVGYDAETLGFIRLVPVLGDG